MRLTGGCIASVMINSETTRAQSFPDVSSCDNLSLRIYHILVATSNQINIDKAIPIAGQNKKADIMFT